MCGRSYVIQYGLDHPSQQDLADYACRTRRRNDYALMESHLSVAEQWVRAPHSPAHSTPLVPIHIICVARAVVQAWLEEQAALGHLLPLPRDALCPLNSAGKWVPFETDKVFFLEAKSAPCGLAGLCHATALTGAELGVDITGKVHFAELNTHLQVCRCVHRRDACLAEMHTQG